MDLPAPMLAILSLTYTSKQVNNEKLCDKGFLVIKDPVGGSSPPCLLSMNVLQDLKTLAYPNKSTVPSPMKWSEGTV